MTASAAVIAALSGLIGGLNQIGVFDRFKQPPPIESASRASASSDSVTARTQDTSTTRMAPHNTGPAPSNPAPRAVRPKRAVPSTTSATDSTVRQMARADTMPARDSAGSDTSHPRTAQPESASAPETVSPPRTGTDSATGPPTQTPSGQIPGGTALELAAANRICSTSSQPGDRVQATVVVPVTGTGGAAVPVGTTAILEVTRLEAPVFLGLRADSLSLNGRGYVLRDATTKVHQREFTAGAGQTGVGIGACIPAGGRITVTLHSPVPLGRGS
jgi:hypothetical protein